MTTLSEADSRRLMVRHGVEVSPFVTAPTAVAGVAAVDAEPSVDYPVAVKLSGAKIAHKTERGLVRLGVAHPAGLEAAGAELLALATPDDGAVELLVSPMVPGQRELIAGATRDPQFGPVVMLGVGGILAEAVGDVAFRLAPLLRVDAEELIDDLASQTLLGPFRGEPAVDRDALVDTVLALARTIAEEPQVLSADLNPLIIVEGRPVAVDALVEVGEPEDR